MFLLFNLCNSLSDNLTIKYIDYIINVNKYTKVKWVIICENDNNYKTLHKQLLSANNVHIINIFYGYTQIGKILTSFIFVANG